MIDLLVDTNILIYFYDGHPTYRHFFTMIEERRLGISVITFMEMLVNITDAAETQIMLRFLTPFEVVPINTMIARDAAVWMQGKKLKSLRHSSLADVLIGQTALVLGVPLVTNNPKDFSAFKSLKLMIPEA